MHLPRKPAVLSSAVFFCSATHFHYTQTQVRINKPRESSLGSLLPHIATETIADVFTVVFKFGAPSYTFLFSFLFPSLSQLILLFFLGQKWVFLWTKVSTKYFVVHFYTVPSKRVEDALKKTNLVGLVRAVLWKYWKYYVGSQAASQKNRNIEFSENFTREIGRKGGQEEILQLFFALCEG